MKLSEVRGERVFDVIADLIPPLCRMASHGSVKEVMGGRAVPDGKDPREHAIEQIERLAPTLIKECKDDVIDVLCVIGGTDRSEYVENMTIMSLWDDVAELLGDDDFISFLSSANVLTGGSAPTSE